MLGATHVVNAREVDAVEAVKELTGGGVDYSFEAIGTKKTAEQASPCSARGGTATIIGMVPMGVTLEHPRRRAVHEREAHPGLADGIQPVPHRHAVVHRAVPRRSAQARRDGVGASSARPRSTRATTPCAAASVPVPSSTSPSSSRQGDQNHGAICSAVRIHRGVALPPQVHLRLLGRAPAARPTCARCTRAPGWRAATIVQALKQLQTGIVVVVDQDSPNCDILKAPPYSAFPSQVEMYVDDEFHSFIGCAHEAVAVSNMPHFHGKEVRLESYCACCLEPITLWSKSFALTRTEPGRSARAHRHADVGLGARRHEVHVRQHQPGDRPRARRSIREADRPPRHLHDARPGAPYVEPAVGIRGWDYHWPPQSMNPEGIIDRIRDLGVDSQPVGPLTQATKAPR